jgi:peptidoglycan/LPS O-acetylase OafA/YrhL
MRLREIDFLRGFAVLLVLFRHHYLNPFFSQIGWIGVDLFFVLSGYLVSDLLFKEYKTTGKVRPFLFLIRRGFKIYPLFYFFLFLTWVLWKFYGEFYFSFSNKLLLSEAAFLQIYVGHIWNHTWSLAVEEHFYFGLAVLMPLAVRFRWLNRPKLVVGFWLFLMVACMMGRARAYDPVHGGEYMWTYFMPTHLRIDSLFFGVVLAYFINFYEVEFKTRFKQDWVFILGLFLISICGFLKAEDKAMGVYGLTAVNIGFGLIVAHFLSKPTINAALNRWISRPIANFIAQIGVYSYGIYLFHMMIERTIMGYVYGKCYYYFPTPDEWGTIARTFPIYLVLSISVGIFLSKIIEFPFLKIRDRYFPK